MLLEELADLIDKHSEDAVEFGDPNCNLAPTNERIEETEQILGCKLPPSYLWFVKTYGGGEVYGEEIYSIYPALSGQSAGDIAYQTRWFRERNFVRASDVVICSNDFGETFFLDSATCDQNGEYPVFIQGGNTTKKYANNFGEFLYKRISNPEG